MSQIVEKCQLSDMLFVSSQIGNKDSMKDRLIFTDAINFWLKKRGLSHAQLADKMSVNRNTITQYISGLRTPPMDRLEDLVKALGVSLPEFFACKDEEKPDIVFVRRVKARPRAGSGGLETDGDYAGLYSFHKSFVSRKGGNENSMKIFEVAGDSMHPTLSDGDLIMVNEADKNVRTGYIYLLRIDEELMVKRLETRPGAVIIRSDNPAYREIEVRKDDESIDFEVFGRMVWSCREY